MLELPNSERAIIDSDKLAESLLSSTYPAGGGKARFLGRLGFATSEPGQLAGALRELLRAPAVVTAEDTGYGTRYIVSGVLRGPAAEARVRSVWMVPRGSDVPRFVTAYPWGE